MAQVTGGLLLGASVFVTAPPVHAENPVPSEVVYKMLNATLDPIPKSTSPLSMEALKAQALKGDVKAAAEVGKRYANGQDVAEDRDESYRWFAMGATKDDAECDYCLSFKYSPNTTSAEDQRLSLKLLTSAAEQGYTNAQYQCGLRILLDTSASKDLGRAYGWFRQAAIQGDQVSLTHSDDLWGKLTAQQQADATRFINSFRPRRPQPGKIPLPAAAATSPVK